MDFAWPNVEIGWKMANGQLLFLALSLWHITGCLTVLLLLQIIEEMDERFNEQQVEEMCEIIRTHLPEVQQTDTQR